MLVKKNKYSNLRTIKYYINKKLFDNFIDFLDSDSGLFTNDYYSYIDNWKL